MSEPQYGVMERPVFRPIQTWSRSVFQRDWVSPDHIHAPHLAIPMTPLRLSVQGRTFGGRHQVPLVIHPDPGFRGS